MTARDVIAQALALSEAASRAPWINGGQGWVFAADTVTGRSQHDEMHDLAASVSNDEDAAFIAAARTLLPALAKALGDVLDVFDDQAVEGFGDTTAAVRIYRAITRALSEVTP